MVMIGEEVARGLRELSEEEVQRFGREIARVTNEPGGG